VKAVFPEKNSEKLLAGYLFKMAKILKESREDDLINFWMNG